MSWIRRTIAALFAGVLIVATLSTIKAEAAPADEFTITGVTDVQRRSDAREVQANVGYSCPTPDSAGQLELVVKQWAAGQPRTAPPSASYSSAGFNPVYCRDASSRVVAFSTTAGSFGLLRTGVADVTVRLVPGDPAKATVIFHNANARLTAQPCCAPEISSVTYLRLRSGTDTADPAHPTRLTAQLRYRCWPTPADPAIIWYAIVTDGTSQYGAGVATAPRDLPDPVCNGRWQYPTVQLDHLCGPSFRAGATADFSASLVIYEHPGYAWGWAALDTKVVIRAPGASGPSRQPATSAADAITPCIDPP